MDVWICVETELERYRH